MDMLTDMDTYKHGYGSMESYLKSGTTCLITHWLGTATGYLPATEQTETKLHGAYYTEI